MNEKFVSKEDMNDVFHKMDKEFSSVRHEMNIEFALVRLGKIVAASIAVAVGLTSLIQKFT